MKFLTVISLCFLLCLCVQSVLSQNAISPPRGWNSYDSFSWIISEEEYLQNADIISKRLLPLYGYQYAVVDYLWYRTLEGDRNSRGFDITDEWGRLLPDPVRWPSSSGGRGFTEVANKVHSMGLKFGIHVMAGISTSAFHNNTPVLDTTMGRAYEESGKVWHAQDIGIPSRACKWMSNGFMAINVTTGAGKAFLRSIYELYASWGVDFVKLDCVFGEDLDLDEITYVSQILKDHSIVFSLSPGVGATPDMAKKVSGLVNTYRVTGDDWDQWSAVVAHFNVARDFAAAKLIGAQGLNGNSWPDLDMLPFGWLTDAAVKQGPHRSSRLNQEEQKTQLTLWCMAKSPIMFGGDLRNLDSWTEELITNPTLLWINAHSSNNTEFPYITIFDVKNEGSTDRIRSWVATGTNDDLSTMKHKHRRRRGHRTRHGHKHKNTGEDTYVAFFNLNDESTTISAKIDDLSKVLQGRELRGCRGSEIWSGRLIVTNDTLSEEVAAHGCALFVIKC